ncbi:hypothetical protein U14_02684 [Candidatus Moduliflexus flocculans]|uniref:Uncharacterized protein n=1 Tax=Candidatus Moduliflexus flocculans TaxID=1499966 RepID=A0A081BM24_9BACT|nr:hypothetical protein U14_02684 [Candidatus Moduliflexus flocculans]
MLLMELEREIVPLPRNEKFELMRFLLEQLAESDNENDARDAELIESRRHEPTFLLTDTSAVKTPVRHFQSV